MEIPGYFRDIREMNGVAYVVTDQVVTAVRLLDGSTEWTYSWPKEGSGGSLELGEESLFVFMECEASHEVYEFDRRTGEVTWRKQLPENSQHAYRNGVLFTGWDTKGSRPTYAAIDARTKQPLWARPGIRSSAARRPHGLLTSRAVILESPDALAVALDVESGEERWRVGHQLGAIYTVFEEIVLLMEEKGVVARDSATGGELWKNETICAWDAAVHGGNFVVRFQDRLIAFDPPTGKIVWEYPLKWENTVDSAPFTTTRWKTSEGDMVALAGTLWVQDTLTHALDANGNRRWRTARLNGTDPVWTDGARLVTRKGGGLYGYTAGEAEPVPRGTAERRGWAEEMAPRFSGLDPWERKRMSDLGEDAFDALFAVARKGRKPASDLESALWHSIGPAAASQIANAFSATIDPEWQKHLLHMMRLAKSPEAFGPSLLAELQTRPLSEWGRGGLIATLLQFGYAPAAPLLWNAFENDVTASSVKGDILWQISKSSPWAAGKVAERIRTRTLRLDHWPDTTRTAESDVERALEAVFALCDKGGVKLEVTYPDGVEPFAMRGSENVCLCQAGAFESGDAEDRLSLIVLGDIQEEYPEGAELPIEIRFRMGIGSEIATMRKVQGEWVPIGKRHPPIYM